MTAESKLQTPNERMSDLATDYAYLRNLQLTKPMTPEEGQMVQIKMDQIEREKAAIAAQFGKATE